MIDRRIAAYNRATIVLLGSMYSEKSIVNGHAYAMLGQGDGNDNRLTFDEWTNLITRLIDAGLVVQADWVLTLTEKGEKLGFACKQALE